MNKLETLENVCTACREMDELEERSIRSDFWWFIIFLVIFMGEEYDENTMGITDILDAYSKITKHVEANSQDSHVI